MERIKINLPNNFSFTTTINIRITDVNYGGHVGNDSFLSLLHEARLQYFKHHQYTEYNIGNVGIIMGDVGIEFKAELFYGDAVNISVAASNFSKYGFDLFYKMEKTDEATTLVAKAKTGMLCFNYEDRKLAHVPKEVVAKLSE